MKRARHANLEEPVEGYFSGDFYLVFPIFSRDWQPTEFR